MGRPLLTAATTVVGLFFAIVLVGDLLLAGGAMMAPRLETVPQAEPSVAMEYTAPEEEAEKAAQVVVTKEVEAERLGTEEVVPPAAPSAVPLSETTVASTSAETPAGEAADEVAAGAAAEGQETGETATTGTPAPMASPEPAEAVGGGAPKEGPTAPESTTSPFPQRAATQPPAPSANAEETPARAAEAAPPEAREVTAAPEPPVEDWDALASEAPPSVTFPLRRVLEIALGLATVGLALVTVWAWRARRR